VAMQVLELLAALDELRLGARAGAGMQLEVRLRLVRGLQLVCLPVLDECTGLLVKRSVAVGPRPRGGGLLDFLDFPLLRRALLRGRHT
jgi:hypothetical protein